MPDCGGERVLLDDQQLFPGGRAETDTGALLLPHDPVDGIATQCPDGLAHFIVLVGAGDLRSGKQLADRWGTRLNDYDLVVVNAPLRLYALARPNARRQCRGLRNKDV